ncbi:MAG: hypothetical protein H8E61_04020, partial [Bacteroidetes bacterium]|nr:hypothetical protein [Bacteroidota bacterium]
MKKKQLMTNLLLLTVLVVSTSINQAHGKIMKNDLAISNSFDANLQQQISNAYEKKGKAYVPRTQHLD